MRRIPQTFRVMKFNALSLFFLLISFQVNLFAQQVVINEVMASNGVTLADDDGDFSDWLELFNYSAEVIDLTGFGLTDREDVPFRWVFPNVSIEPGAYMVIWASGKDRRTPGSALHTNFSISASGEELMLTSRENKLVDYVPATAIPSDISFGRKPDGSASWYFFSTPTPGAANLSHGYEGILTEPVFSSLGGFYTGDFHLEISSGNDGANVYYTLDGSVPDATTNLYTGPISISSLEGRENVLSMIPTNNNPEPGPPYYEGWQPPAGEVQKANVVRAVALKDNYLPGPVATHNYLVHQQGSARYSLPVFFMNTHATNLFDPETGIYHPGNHNNMFRRGQEWERPMHLTLYEKGGVYAFSNDFGFRIHGGTTRSRPRKSLRIYARGEYGLSWLNYRLFAEKDVNRYKRFLLRNSGNDWDQAVIRDGFMQFLARDLHVETQYYRPAILFINGEYWGIHNTRDRYDEHYIYSHYGLEEHEMSVLENNSLLAYGNPDGVVHYDSLRSIIRRTDMADSVNFAHAGTMMDMESFADFQIANIYIMNTDWPGNNTNYWRRLADYDPEAPPGLDGRWRWMMLDTDFGFGLNFFYVPGVNQGPAHNTLALALDPGRPDTHWPNPAWSTMMLRRLLDNQGFRHHFINRFADLLNTTFREQRVVAVLDSIQSALLPEMTEHIARWRRPVTVEEWLQNMQVMRSFGQRRADYVRQHIRSHFDLDGLYTLTLRPEDAYMGKIRVNTVKPEMINEWTGIYFRGIPIILEAEPRPGYRFSHWSGALSGSDPVIELTPTGDIRLAVHFEIDPDFTGPSLNPLIPYKLSQGPYIFDAWDPEHPEGTFPPHMLFLQSSVDDPGLDDRMTHPYHIPEGDYHADDLGLAGFPYKLSGRTRLNGLGASGISFINTGRGRDLGAAVLAIDTRGEQDITVSWTGGTLIPNARVYAIRLQYKTGIDGLFRDVKSPDGQAVEYMRSETAGHEQRIGPVTLPADANNQPYVQLRWKYYYTGERLDADHGRRDMLRLDDMEVSSSELGDNELVLNVKMRVWAEQYQQFDPETDYVDVAGTFNAWIGDAYRFTRIPDDPDLTYTITISGLEPGLEYRYKCRINGSWEDGLHEFPGQGRGRTFTMQQGRNEFAFWFNDEEPATNLPVIESPAVSVYPNPAQDLMIVASGQIIREVRLINAVGQVVQSIKTGSGMAHYRESGVAGTLPHQGRTNTIDSIHSDHQSLQLRVAGFDPGIYLVQVLTNSGVITKRIMIVR